MTFRMDRQDNIHYAPDTKRTILLTTTATTTAPTMGNAGKGNNFHGNECSANP